MSCFACSVPWLRWIPRKCLRPQLQHRPALAILWLLTPALYPAVEMRVSTDRHMSKRCGVMTRGETDIEFRVRTNSCPNERTRTNILSRFPSLRNVVEDRRCVARKLSVHSSIDKHVTAINYAVSRKTLHSQLGHNTIGSWLCFSLIRTPGLDVRAPMWNEECEEHISEMNAYRVQVKSED